MRILIEHIKVGIALHCTRIEHAKWLVENGYAYPSLLDKFIPFWFRVRDGKSSDWMPEIKVIDEEEKIFLKGADYYIKQGLELVEFEELILEW